MSVGRHAARRAAHASEEAASLAKDREMKTAEQLKKERLRAQQMFIRQARARQGGGFFDQREVLG